MQAKTMKIGQLAKAANVSVETLRYYETQGLLSAHSRSSAGYRFYLPQDLERLRFIRHAQNVGFSLKEIQYLLGIRLNKAAWSCESVKDYTGAKIQEIDAKIRDLQSMRRTLNRMYSACCGGEESAVNCSILQMLEAEDDNFDIRRTKEA